MTKRDEQYTESVKAVLFEAGDVVAERVSYIERIVKERRIDKRSAMHLAYAMGLVDASQSIARSSEVKA